MNPNKSFAPQPLGVSHLLLLLVWALRSTSVSSMAWLTVSDALQQVARPPPDGNKVEGAELKAPIQTQKSDDDSDKVNKTQVESPAPAPKGNANFDSLKRLQVETTPFPKKLNGHSCDVGKAPVQWINGPVFMESYEEKPRQEPHQAPECTTLERRSSISSTSCGGGVGTSLPTEAGAVAKKGTRFELPSSSCTSGTGTNKGIALFIKLSRKHRKGAEASSSKLRSSASTVPSARNPPEVYAAARALTSQIKTLLHPVSDKRSSTAKSVTMFSGLLRRSVTDFLPTRPTRRSGLLEPMVCCSDAGAEVLRYLRGLFPLKIKSTFHAGSTKSLVIAPTCPTIHSRGRLSLCVEFLHDKHLPLLNLTVLFVQGNGALGYDVVQMLNRVAAAQLLAIKAGLPRPADVAKHLQIGTPLDVVQISKDEVLDLGSVVVCGYAVLERRMWAPLTTVVRQMDQAQGRKNIRIADQARLSLTGQVVEVVSTIRSKKIVLPRLTLGDFGVDSSGAVSYLFHRVTDVLTEEDLNKPSGTAGQVQASQGTPTEASTATALSGTQSLHARSNSVGLALLLLEMWCRLTPEQTRARTPAREIEAQLSKLDFSTCLSTLPPEVKELVTVLHGAIGRPSIPAADAVSTNPFQTLLQRLGHAERLGRQAERNREAAQHIRKAHRKTDFSSLRVPLPHAHRYSLRSPLRRTETAPVEMLRWSSTTNEEERL